MMGAGHVQGKGDGTQSSCSDTAAAMGEELGALDWCQTDCNAAHLTQSIYEGCSLTYGEGSDECEQRVQSPMDSQDY